MIWSVTLPGSKLHRVVSSHLCHYNMSAFFVPGQIQTTVCSSGGTWTPFYADTLDMMWSLGSHVDTALSGGQLTLYAAEDSNSHF